MDVLTPDDLQRYLTEQHIAAEIVRVSAHTPTVPAAAEALGVTVDQIVKTVLFLIDGQPHAVMANGVRRIDTRKLAAAFNVNRKKVKLADSDAVIALTGYLPGAVAPLAHRQPLSMVMDPAVRRVEIVYAGGGGIAEMLRIRSDDLLRLTRARLLDVLEDELPTQ